MRMGMRPIKAIMLSERVVCCGDIVFEIAEGVCGVCIQKTRLNAKAKQDRPVLVRSTMIMMV